MERTDLALLRLLQSDRRMSNAEVAERINVSAAIRHRRTQRLIEQNGRPGWRSTASVRWHRGKWGAGAFYNYVGEVIDTSVTGPDDEIFVVDSSDTLAVSGDYTFEDWLGGGMRVRVGARNVFDEDPPFADEFASGYSNTLRTNRGRFVYLDLRKEF